MGSIPLPFSLCALCRYFLRKARPIIEVRLFLDSLRTLENILKKLHLKGHIKIGSSCIFAK